MCESDGRGQLAVLTDDGFAALEAAAPVHVESVRTHLFDQLTPSRSQNMRDIGETLLAPPRPRRLTGTLRSESSRGRGFGG